MHVTESEAHLPPSSEESTWSEEAADRGTGKGLPGFSGASQARHPLLVQFAVGGAELAVYAVVATLLVVAAGFIAVGTVTDLVEGSKSRDIADAGVFVLDRILLLFIIAELLYTLRLVILGGGQIRVEPFLFIGLIAVVRRVLVATAEFEGNGRQEVVDFVIQIGALAVLALVLTMSIHLLRRNAIRQEA